MYCSNCGAEIANTAKFCHKCGHKVWETDSPNTIENNHLYNEPGPMNRIPQGYYSPNENKSKLTDSERKQFIGLVIIGIVFTLIGLVFVFSAIGTYVADTSGWIPRYTYSGRLTNHEIWVIASGVSGLVMSLSGTADIFWVIYKSSAIEKSRKN